MLQSFVGFCCALLKLLPLSCRQDLSVLQDMCGVTKPFEMTPDHIQAFFSIKRRLSTYPMCVSIPKKGAVTVIAADASNNQLGAVVMQANLSLSHQWSHRPKPAEVIEFSEMHPLHKHCKNMKELVCQYDYTEPGPNSLYDSVAKVLNFIFDTSDYSGGMLRAILWVNVESVLGSADVEELKTNGELTDFLTAISTNYREPVRPLLICKCLALIMERPVVILADAGWEENLYVFGKEWLFDETPIWIGAFFLQKGGGRHYEALLNVRKSSQFPITSLHNND